MAATRVALLSLSSEGMKAATIFQDRVVRPSREDSRPSEVRSCISLERSWGSLYHVGYEHAFSASFKVFSGKEIYCGLLCELSLTDVGILTYPFLKHIHH